MFVAFSVTQKKTNTLDRRANSDVLLEAKDFGAGLSTLLLESYHTHNWIRQPVQIDSTITPASVQQLARQLNLPIRVSVIVSDPRVRQKVPTGGVMPETVLNALADTWDPRVPAVCELAALLRWTAWQGVLLQRGYGGTIVDHLEADLQDSWPGVARRINERLQQLGMSDRLDEVYSSNRDEVAERCLKIDDALEKFLSGDDQ